MFTPDEFKIIKREVATKTEALLLSSPKAIATQAVLKMARVLDNIPKKRTWVRRFIAGTIRRQYGEFTDKSSRPETDGKARFLAALPDISVVLIIVATIVMVLSPADSGSGVMLAGFVIGIVGLLGFVMFYTLYGLSVSAIEQATPEGWRDDFVRELLWEIEQYGAKSRSILYTAAPDRTKAALKEFLDKPHVVFLDTPDSRKERNTWMNFWTQTYRDYRGILDDNQFDLEALRIRRA